MKKIATILLSSVTLLFVSCNDYDYDVVEDEMFVITEETSGPGTGYTWCWDKKDDVVDTLRRAFIPYALAAREWSAGYLSASVKGRQT